MHHTFLYRILLVCVAFSIFMPFGGCTVEAVAPSTRPNVIFIMADDMGYGDPHCNNPQSTIPTPHLDNLASQGMRFTDAHSPSAVCTPTRYGVITGRYCWRSRLKGGVLGGYSAPLIEDGRLTVAQLMHNAGYRTGCVGKWHLGLGWPTTDGSRPPQRWNNMNPKIIDWSKPLYDGPHTRGFDYSYIIPASLDMTPYVYIEDGKVTEGATAKLPGSKFPAFFRGGAAAPSFTMIDSLDHLTDKACHFIKTSARSDKPFFLYLPLPAPHKPVIPAERFQGKSQLGPYGDFIMQVDEVVGKVDRALAEAGARDNTLVIYTSDNGSFMYSIDRSPNYAKKTTDDHVANESVQAYLDKHHMPNYTWRGTKADIWEGGHRVPYLVRWPGKVKPGATCDVTITHTDLMATCAELVGTPLPDDAAEDSFSILPLLRGQPAKFQRAPTVHHSVNGSFALRDGKWKMVFTNGSGGRERPGSRPFSKPYQLYDMRADPAESKNVIDQHPDIAKRMEEQLEQIRTSGRSR